MATLNGLDASIEMTRYAVALKSQGVDFVIRYYSHAAGKNLSLAEARALSEADLQIGVMWETNCCQPSYFNRAQGLADGASAYLMAHATIGQPSGSGIYFTIDYDATEAELCGPISEYFRGVQQAFESAEAGEPRYEVGVYGSELCLSTLVDSGLATLTWLSQAAGFRGNRHYVNYNLRQLPPGILKVDDGRLLHVDMNETHSGRRSGLFSIL